MTAPYLPLEIRVMAAVLALVGVPSSIWPVRFNRPFANGLLERLVWRNPGVITAWLIRLLSIYWTAVWGWAALFGRWPPYFPT